METIPLCFERRFMMAKNFIRYNISVRHLKGFERENRQTVYKRVISIHETLDEAIEKLINITLQEDPNFKCEVSDIIDEINENKDDLMNEEYSIVFETLHDYMPDEKKWYWGSGAFTLKGSALQ